MKTTSLVLAVSLLGLACIAVPERPDGAAPPSYAPPPAPPPQPPPPPPPRLMTSEEALRAGEDFCRSRGYGCSRPRVERLGGFWRVRFDARGAQRQGPLYLDFDAATRALARADEPPELPPPPPPPAPYPRPAPAPAPMSRDEAIGRAVQLCRERWFDCRLEGAYRDGDVWLVDLAARRDRVSGTFRAGFDAFSREVLSVDEPRSPAPLPAPPPPPPAPRLMTQAEASARGYEVCAEQRFTCRLLGSALAGNVWRLDYDARRPDVVGTLHVEIDAVSRAVVRLDEPRRAAPPPAPPPPPPAPRLMTQAEAAARGYEICAERRFTCRLLGAALAGNVWRLDYEARRPDAAGPLHVDIDALSRAVVRLDEPRPRVRPEPAPIPAPAPPPAPAPAPAPPPRPMTFEEASARGLAFCREHGYDCRMEDAHLERGRGVWRLKLDALTPARGRVELELDAATRAVVRAREDVRR